MDAGIGRVWMLGTLHDLSLALVVGGIAGAAVSALALFGKAPSREVAGEVGQLLFQRLGQGVLILSMVVLVTRLVLARSEPATTTRTVSVLLAAAALALSAVVALWLTPRMGVIWTASPHAPDGSGLLAEDRRLFMALHGIANLCYISILVMGAAQIALRAVARRT
ncbi:MAG TPA: DUF4149 domain-containing protein [Candidatus Polarisedimenticolia bacterium]|nr:DUF4149 domain-containing protein [Candidatus Polarisedimenticolia bacterium]